MSNRFTFMFFFMVLLANFFFFEKTEPADYQNLADKLLSLFLFQFDYFLLFVYVSSKFVKNTIRPLFWLAFVYGCLFLLGISSIIIVDEIQFEVFYSYVQPLFRAILIAILLSMGLSKISQISRLNIILLVLGLIAGVGSLFLLYSYPRPAMGSFYFYWLTLLSFLVIGLLVKSTAITKLFAIGLFFVYLSDIYYILPPEVRTYEWTYFYVRLINTTGEFLVVYYLLVHYLAGVEKLTASE